MTQDPKRPENPNTEGQGGSLRVESRRASCQPSRRRLAAEGALAAQHFVQHATEAENVRAMIRGLPPHLLRRHVGHRAQDRAWRGLRALRSRLAEREGLNPTRGCRICSLQIVRCRDRHGHAGLDRAKLFRSHDTQPRAAFQDGAMLETASDLPYSATVRIPLSIKRRNARNHTVLAVQSRYSLGLYHRPKHWT